ncbi:Mitochondrial substrate/solute carrier [Sesbania bispinosa]|nr:Mitochondrial substrate/solute carrier [Sesbania bispinosa]
MNVVVQRACYPQLRYYINATVSGLLPFIQKVGLVWCSLLPFTTIVPSAEASASSLSSIALSPAVSTGIVEEKQIDEGEGASTGGSSLIPFLFPEIGEVSTAKLEWKSSPDTFIFGSFESVNPLEEEKASSASLSGEASSCLFNNSREISASKGRVSSVRMDDVIHSSNLFLKMLSRLRNGLVDNVFLDNTVESTKRRIKDSHPSLRGHLEHFIAGAIGNTLGTFVYVPCEVIMQRMQVQGTITSWSSVAMKDGLYAGCLPMLESDIPFSGLMVLFNEALKFFDKMLSTGLQPDMFIYNAIVKGWQEGWSLQKITFGLICGCGSDIMLGATKLLRVIIQCATKVGVCRRQLLEKIDKELTKGDDRAAMALVKDLQGELDGLQCFGAARQVPQRLYTLDELKLNGIETLSLLSPVDTTLGSIERNLQIAAIVGGLAAWNAFGISPQQLFYISLGLLWTLDAISFGGGIYTKVADVGDPLDVPLIGDGEFAAAATTIGIIVASFGGAGGVLLGVR